MDKIKTDIDRLFLEASQRGRDMTKTKLILMELLDRGYHVEEELGRLESDRKWSGDKNDIDFSLNWDEGDE